jgi:DNA-nicking Smr family endonuclease
LSRHGRRVTLEQLADLVKRREQAATANAEPAREAADEDAALFRRAVAGATPIAAPERQRPMQPPLPPGPIQSFLDDYEVLSEIGADPSGHADFYDTGEEEAYLRPGVGTDVLRKLRRLEWKIQAEVSLRRLRQDEAHAALTAFLRECVDRGDRCVRVIHGKGIGSPNREPVLKRKVKSWLARRDEVLAFCQAPPQAGGGGALLVLLKG